MLDFSNFKVRCVEYPNIKISVNVVNSYFISNNEFLVFKSLFASTCVPLIINMRNTSRNVEILILQRVYSCIVYC